MATMIPSAPRTPRKKETEEINLKIKSVISSLCFHWDLRLEQPNPYDSPIKRSERPPTVEQEIVFKIKVHCFKRSIDPLVQKFTSKAHSLYSGWVKKPKAERGVVPEETRQTRKPVTSSERTELLQCLLRILTEKYGLTLTPKPAHKSPLSLADSLDSGGQREPYRRLLDDSPLPLSFPPRTKEESKRSREQLPDEDAHFKKPRLPQARPRQSSTSRTRSFNDVRQLDRSMSGSEEGKYTISADTSFTSDVSSIFSNVEFNNSRGYLGVLTQDTVLTQTTTLDEDLDFLSQPPRQINSAKEKGSSEYEGGSSFDATVLEVLTSSSPLGDESEVASAAAPEVRHLSQNMMDCGLIDSPEAHSGQDELQKMLQGIFPDMPSCWIATPIFIRYEILRVSLYTGVPLTDIPSPPSLDWNDYDALWTFLRNVPSLSGKTFPEKVSKEVWMAVCEVRRRGTRSIVMSGSLRFCESSSSNILFRFLLEPLKLERSHRLERRFGSDRFFEIDIPHLSGWQLPKVLRNLGSKGKSLICKWMVNEPCQIIGRVWKPFSVKPKRGKERKSDASDPDTGAAHRVYLFAVDGYGFQENTGTPKVSETVESRSRMTVDSLLNWLRPTEENKVTLALKLFARTPLGLSRNTPTVIIDRSQIRYRPDLRCNGEVMTDGAGRLSLTLALQIVQSLGLSYLPSGFQARFGEAKGFWSIDPQDHGSEKWIEVYRSQQKWERNGAPEDMDFDDPSHRTFEVNKCSGMLKPADLNVQLLPILMDRAISHSAMRKAISKVLEDGLTEEIMSQRVAMENPQSFRKWVRDWNPGLKDRVKYGLVPFKASLPVSLSEKLNMFLDAGFHPMKLRYLKELAQKAYTSKFEDLKKKLNITVPRSTYAFMVPDFAGVLEQDEIYIHFSESFVDELSPLSGVPLHGVDVLVARSPAHFVSDIQRVKAVIKLELMGLKDVIVFPTKGNPSLADKLSGGDYDGDIAWVCWEPTIVQNFRNAEVPKCPDLMSQGYISKDFTTYEQLSRNEADPNQAFLRWGFEFNMEQSMLGICTNFKEDLCYAHGKLDSPQAVFLCTLLSCLVDQAKQGYIFTMGDWDMIKKTVIKETPQEPLYKSDHIDPKATHIVDRLKYVAHMTIEKILTDLHKNMPETSYWDSDLVEYCGWAEKEAINDEEWSTILARLKSDIASVRAVWARNFGANNKTEESKSTFGSVLTECYDLFQAIKPIGDTPLTRSLLEGWHGNSELSQWALLRASVTFGSFPRKYVSNFVWWMAGVQLAQLKARRLGGMVVMTPHMYAMEKPDATFVKLRQNEDPGVVQGRDSGGTEEMDVEMEMDGDNYDDD